MPLLGWRIGVTTQQLKEAYDARLTFRLDHMVILPERPVIGMGVHRRDVNPWLRAGCPAELWHGGVRGIGARSGVGRLDGVEAGRR